MNRALLPAVLILVVCAVSDLASVPPLLSASGTDAPPTAVVVLIGGLGLATLGAAAGLRTGSRRSWRVSVAIRVVDGVAAALGLAASDGTVVAAAATTLVLSAVAVVALVRSSRYVERATGIEPLGVRRSVTEGGRPCDGASRRPR